MVLEPARLCSFHTPYTAHTIHPTLSENACCSCLISNKNAIEPCFLVPFGLHLRPPEQQAQARGQSLAISLRARDPMPAIDIRARYPMLDSSIP
eukprot:3811283-Rhodomonas_salina.2